MQITIPITEAKTLLLERISVLNELLPPLDEKIQDEKERYIQIKVASAWWHRDPKYWDSMWENGESGDGLWASPDKRWNKYVHRLEVIESVVGQMKQLIAKLDKIALDGVTEATLNDSEINLVWFKDAVK